MIKIRQHEEKLTEIKPLITQAEALDLYTIESEMNGIGYALDKGKMAVITKDGYIMATYKQMEKFAKELNLIMKEAKELANLGVIKWSERKE